MMTFLTILLDIDFSFIDFYIIFLMIITIWLMINSYY